MADGQEMDEDLFADLYDGEDVDPESSAPAPKVEASAQTVPVKQEEQLTSALDPTPAEQVVQNFTSADSYNDEEQSANTSPTFNGSSGYGNQQNGGGGFGNGSSQQRPIGSKEDGKMFIGGLNWETTDQSLKEYFSQFGEVVECTVMRDGPTGRSRGFGFLTFKDPKTVNIVMVKEHELDGKLIDPKRAIPRDEQERTAKIFVGGVSQEATEPIFREFFEQFGTVLDATLMMDKDTGRPRGFGFVTFDGDAAVDRTLEGPLAILGKSIEVKRAQPRGNMRDDEGPRGGKFGGRGGKQEGFQSHSSFGGQDQSNGGGEQNPNNMSPAMMAQYWQRMQQYFQMMQQQMSTGMGAGGMNMAAMQQNPAMMQQMMQRQGMNPAMMQQMQTMQQQQQQTNGAFANMTLGGSPMNGGTGARSGFSAQEQLMFEQQKYERQALGGGPAVAGGNQNTWDGMYEGAEAPAGFNNQQIRGGFNGRGRGGRGSQQATPQPVGQAPVGAPTGPKNAGRAGANYRGGGRGGARGVAGAGGFHPYSRPGVGS